jgi:hypothetical protein
MRVFSCSRHEEPFLITASDVLRDAPPLLRDTALHGIISELFNEWRWLNSSSPGSVKASMIRIFWWLSWNISEPKPDHRSGRATEGENENAIRISSSPHGERYGEGERYALLLAKIWRYTEERMKISTQPQFRYFFPLYTVISPEVFMSKR